MNYLQSQLILANVYLYFIMIGEGQSHPQYLVDGSNPVLTKFFEIVAIIKTWFVDILSCTMKWY